MKKPFSFVLLFFIGFFGLLLGCDKPSQAVSEVRASGTTMTKGSPDAPITIIDFSDFQCPACKHANVVVEEILNNYGDKVYFIFRPFPLQSHNHGFSSAVASECARQQGRFWDYHDHLFENQYEWGSNNVTIDIKSSRNLFSDYAKTLGLDTAKFNQCLTSRDAEAMIKASRQQGMNLRVQSTPTFFINNKRVVGGKSLQATYENIFREILNK